MEVNVTYTAKDGTRFNDLFECEKYERRLGAQPGTVARARIELKDLGEDSYVFGMFKVIHKDHDYCYTYITQCIDEKLEDYVNVSSLDVDKRWIRNTIADVLHSIEKFDDDDLCEYEFLYCDHWEFDGKHTLRCAYMRNPDYWQELDRRVKSRAAGR